MKRRLTLIGFFVVMLAGSMSVIVGVSAQSPLTLAMILTGLQTKGSTPETSTLARRNVYIQKRVEQNGVTFRVTPEIETELRNAGATPTLIAVIRRNGPSATPTPTPRTNARASAAFRNMRVDYDVTEEGKIGMRMYLSFTTYGMRNVDSYLAIYFLDSRGVALRDKNGQFTSTSGEVAVYKELKPAYDPAEFNDLSVFMPYDEFELPVGKYDLVADVKVIYKTGGAIADLTRREFNYSKGNPVRRPPTKPTWKVNRVWVDYNVTRNNRRGMLVHVNFEVTGMKDYDGILSVRVAKSDNTFVMNSNSGFTNSSGQLQIDYPIKPAYSPAYFEDAQLFLPYNEIKLTRGKWQLRLDIDLNYGDGELIQHMQFYDFEFTQP